MLIFLGIPLAAGFLTRRVGLRRKGREWYEQRFLPRISPIRLYGLLFTIVLLFAIQGASSGEALAGVVGPLIEVPVLVSLVYVALWLARRLRWPSPLGLSAGGGAARLRLLNGNRTP